MSTYQNRRDEILDAAHSEGEIFYPKEVEEMIVRGIKWGRNERHRARMYEPYVEDGHAAHNISLGGDGANDH